tara:strand:+ start:29597 stop:29965 length:369 start_codon:yes stop_codon:yes gene_type:complete
MPVNYNLDITQGSSFSAQLFAKNANGTAVDLNGYSLSGVMKYNYGTGTSLVDLSPTVNLGTNSLGQTNTAASGVVDISLTHTQTAALPVTMAVYDVEMYNGDYSEVRKLLDGRVTIYPEVTR